jgi:translation initiation factor 4A
MSNNNENSTPEYLSFSDFNFPDKILRGIYAYGWEQPSSTQVLCLPTILKNRDVLIQAQSGTGKTGTFSLGLLNNIVPEHGSIQGLIILPTIELATQVFNVISSLAEYMELNFILCVGGKTVRDMLTYPDRATILVGTPGKLGDVCKKNIIRSQEMNLKVFVIDEFDRTFDKDFIPDVKLIFEKCVYESTQKIFISATINDDVRNICNDLLYDPVEIVIRPEEVSVKGIQQYYINVDRDDDKFDTILDIYKSVVVGQCIIFVNSKDKCNVLEKRFKEADFTINHIHGNMDRKDREMIMSDFVNGKIKILLTTDLMARGIDVQTISLVINYDMPFDSAQYIHRVGRTGRYGKKGFAINLIGNDNDYKSLKAIEKYYSIKIEELPFDFAKLL